MLHIHLFNDYAVATADGADWEEWRNEGSRNVTLDMIPELDHKVQGLIELHGSYFATTTRLLGGYRGSSPFSLDYNAELFGEEKPLALYLICWFGGPVPPADVRREIREEITGNLANVGLVEGSTYQIHDHRDPEWDGSTPVDDFFEAIERTFNVRYVV